MISKKIIIRCDGGAIPEIGTGHIYRCKTIADFLIKNNKLKKKNFLFLTKRYGKYKFGYDYLKKFFPIYKLKKNSDLSEKNEIKIISKLKSKLIIFDKLDNFRKKKVFLIKKNHKKIVLIDSSSDSNRLVDLKINPLVNTNKNKLKSLKQMIIPIKKLKIKKQDILFIFFGGYDHKKLTAKVNKVCDNLFKNFTICSMVNTNIKKNKFIAINDKNFNKLLALSKYSITSGGLTMFQSIYYKNLGISIPQYNHQIKNIKNSGCTIYCSTKNFMNNLIKSINLLKNKNKMKKYEKKINLLSKEFEKHCSLKKISRLYRLYD